MPIPACWSRCAREGALSEAETSPRARRNLLEGAFDWATPVARGGHCRVGHALCVRLSERCFDLIFAGFKQDSPDYLMDPQGCP
jgi:hypothetical protein